MMVRASMHMACVVRMHGWAIKYGTTNHDLPFYPTPSYDHLHAVPPRLPHQELGDNNPQDGSVAPQGKTLCRSTQKSQEIQETYQKTARQSQKSNTWNLPLPGCFRRL
jgi:hypothetical protein